MAGKYKTTLVGAVLVQNFIRTFLKFDWPSLECILGHDMYQYSDLVKKWLPSIILYAVCVYILCNSFDLLIVLTDGSV